VIWNFKFPTGHAQLPLPSRFFERYETGDSLTIACDDDFTFLAPFDRRHQGVELGLSFEQFNFRHDDFLGPLAVGTQLKVAPPTAPQSQTTVGGGV
jgi:hypothetical protein